MAYKPTTLETFNAGTFKEQYEDVNTFIGMHGVKEANAGDPLGITSNKKPRFQTGEFSWPAGVSLDTTQVTIFKGPKNKKRRKSPALFADRDKPDPDTKFSNAEDDRHHGLSTSGSPSSRWKDETKLKLVLQRLIVNKS